MAEQRIKGQEVEIQIVADNTVQASLNAIQSFESVLKFELKEEHYLGEKSGRYDEIFNGYTLALDLHFSNVDVFDFFQTVQDRAQRRTPSVVVNIKATLNFPNGQRRRLLFPDIFFEDIPLNFASRSDYGTVSISGAGSTPRRI